MEEFGLEGYGFYWLCCELIGQQGVKYCLKNRKNWFKALKSTSNLSEEKIDKLLKRFAELNLISHNSLKKGDLYIPKMREYSDEYTKRLRRMSEQSMVTIDNNTLQEIIRHYIKTKGWLIADKKLISDIIKRNCHTAKKLYGLVGEDIEKVKEVINWMARQDYKWSLETVIKKYPDFINYCPKCHDVGRYENERGYKVICDCPKGQAIEVKDNPRL